METFEKLGLLLQKCFYYEIFNEMIFYYQFSVQKYSVFTPFIGL